MGMRCKKSETSEENVKKRKVEFFRTNGWTCPPHPLQLTAWFVLIVYATIYYTTIVPALHSSWQPAAYTVLSVSIVGYMICNLVASTIDPVDPAVLVKKHPKQKYDRSKHKHVIEERHCYICRTDVAETAKHCRQCNKCVVDFDHHCKWLNNCVGSANYRWFLATLVTVMIAITLVTGISLLEFITYFTDQTDHLILQPYRDLNATADFSEANFKILYFTVIHEVWLALLAGYSIIAAVGLCSIMQLFLLHIYLMKNDLTTFKYWERKWAKDDDSDTSSIASGKHGQNRIMPDETFGMSGLLTSGLSTQDFEKTIHEANIHEAYNNSMAMGPEPTDVKKKKKKKIVAGDNEIHISTIGVYDLSMTTPFYGVGVFEV